MANIKRHRFGEIDAMYFDKMPQRCKEMFFEILNDDSIPCEDRVMMWQVINFSIDECESPIESIFNFAFEICCFLRGKNTGLYLMPQCEIHAKDKTYRGDFVFDTDECESPYAKYDKPLKLVIECDGHEFHKKTKAQVTKDNQRDMDLKLAGYDILHFSGSQIFNDPFKCANETIDYIISRTT